MIKIIKNPNEEWMKGTELYGKKRIFMCEPIAGKFAYAKIGFGPLFGYILMKIKYRKK